MLQSTTWFWEETALAFRPLGKEPQLSVDGTFAANGTDNVLEVEPRPSDRGSAIWRHTCKDYRWICRPVTIWRGTLTCWFCAGSTGPWPEPFRPVGPPPKPCGG